MVKKIALLGASGIGKTQWIHRDFFKQENYKYYPTIGVEVYSLLIGEETINVWDISGNEKFSGLIDGYLVASDGAIVVANSSSEALPYVKILARLNIPYLFFNPSELVGEEPLKQMLKFLE